MSFCCPFPTRRRPVKKTQLVANQVLETTSGMQVQLKEVSQKQIDNKSTIIFNNVVTNLNPNIAYNSSTGRFTVLKEGTYLIDWWVNIANADANTTFSLGILSSTGELIEAYTIASVNGIQLKGQSLLYLPQNAYFELINTTGSTLTLMDANIQGDLRVVKI